MTLLDTTINLLVYGDISKIPFLVTLLSSSNHLFSYYSDKRIDDTDNTTVVVKIVFNLYPDVRIRTIMSICFINDIIKTKNIFGAFGISFIGLEYCSHIINSIVIHLSSDSDYKKYSWRQEI